LNVKDALGFAFNEGESFQKGDRVTSSIFGEESPAGEIVDEGVFSLISK
jgi:hypothetical protein